MIAIVAAVAATIGDLLLLATSNATRPGFEWLPPPSEAALVAGTYLGVLAIPCYGLGYRAVAARFDAGYRGPLTALGVVGGVLGGTTHGLTGLAIHVERMGGGAGVDPITVLGRYGSYLLPLWGAIGLASLVGSAVYAAGVFRRRSSLPHWMALVSPVVLTLALVLLGRGSATGEAFLVPAAPNVAHVLFFGLVAATRPGAPSRPAVARPLDMPRRSGQ
jgi:hypothetical protein